MSSSEADRQVLIIGIGNPMRGDDGVGPAIAQRLEKAPLGDSVRILPCQQLLPEMAEDLSQVGLAIFIDASCDLPPGEVRCLPVEAVLDVPQASTHDFDPPGLLRLSNQLFGRAPRAMIMAIGAESFEFVETLSPCVQRASDQVIQRVKQIVAEQASGKDSAHA